MNTSVAVIAYAAAKGATKEQFLQFWELLNAQEIPRTVSAVWDQLEEAWSNVTGN